jgi:hypothetical protein
MGRGGGCFGGASGGPCLTCGHIIMIGADAFDVDFDFEEGTATAAPLSSNTGGQGLEPGKGVSSGKRV